MPKKRKSQRSRISPVRLLVSTVILGFVVGLVFVEVRAARGYHRTVASFQENSSKGWFDDMTFDELRELLVYSPSVSEESSTEREVEYCYRWFSLFRRDLHVYVVTTREEPRQAVQWATVSAGPDSNLASDGDD